MILEFNIESQRLTLKNANYIVSNSKNYVELSFIFSSEWNNLVKTLILYNSTKPSDIYQVILVNNKCKLPTVALADIGKIYLGVVGQTANADTIITTNKAAIEVEQGTYKQGEIPEEPEPNIYEQIISIMETQRVDALAAIAAQQASEAARDLSIDSKNKAEISEDNAKESEDKAKVSETNSKNSETSALNSAATATQKAQAALLSEGIAKTYKEAAEAAKDTTLGYKDAAKTYNDEAKASKNAAKISEDNAKESETNAKESENAAVQAKNDVDTNIAEGFEMLEGLANDFIDTTIEKTADFNDNASNKTNTFNLNANSKTTDFNNNATEKTNIINQIKDDVDDLKDETLGYKNQAKGSADDAKDSEDDAEQALADLLAMLGSSVATLTGGKLTPSQIPDISINDVFSVVDTDAMLLLTAQRGDVAIIVVENIVTDSYILAADDPTILSNWKKLGVSYVANAGHSTTADNATDSEKINGKRLVGMTETQYASAVLDEDTYYMVYPD